MTPAGFCPGPAPPSEPRAPDVRGNSIKAPPPPLNANHSAPNLPAADDTFDWTSAGVGAVAIGGQSGLAAGLGLTRRTRVNSNELIDAAQAIPERVPVDHARS
jgi:hypothetical protein